VHDDVGLRGLHGGLQRGQVLQHGLGGDEGRKFAQHGVAVLLEPYVVVIREAVVAVHGVALGQQEPRQVKTDEAGGAGDENFHASAPNKSRV
jgi:hypothetical protein